MGNVFKRILFISNLIKNGKIKYIWDVFKKQIHSEEIAYGFKRDLNKEAKEPRVLKKVTTRISEESDHVYFTDNITNGLIFQFKTCYVAITQEGVPCFRCWLIDSSQNEKLHAVWGNIFPDLKNDEVLFENVFTAPKYRGLGILPAVLHQISEISKDSGANYAISFGAIKNINTSRSFNYAGFHPYILRKEKWRLFKQTVTYEEIPPDLMEFYNKITRRMPKSKK